MADRIEFVLSAGNNPYQLWQSMLFHYSCRKHQGVSPLIVVHNGDEPLLDGFTRIVDVGGRVQQAPNLRELDGFIYSPRNTPTVIRCAETDAEYLMLFDPDMVFLKPVPLDELGYGLGKITFDRVTYLDPDRAEYQPAVDIVCRQMGLDPQVLRTTPINAGVPHILPTSIREEMAEHWLHALKLFVQYGQDQAARNQSEPEIHWVSSMWATIFAVHLLKLEPLITSYCLNNANGADPLPPIESDGPAIVHYCYGSEGFNKRDFLDLDGAERRVWQVPPDDGTINGAIRGQLLEAREFYRL